MATVTALIGTAAHTFKGSERGPHGSPLAAETSRASVAAGGPAAPRSGNCSEARHGLRYYHRVVERWRHKMGTSVAHSAKAKRATAWPTKGACPLIRKAAKFWRHKAIEWRHRYKRWHKAQLDEWNWRAWLPDKYRRVGICETGL